MLLTEPIRTDVVSTFKITDKSIFEAIEMGLRKDDILGFLERESSKPVPKNVVRSIEDWVSQTTFATLTPVNLFETDTERDLDDLMLIPDFKKHVVRQVGPTAVVVRGDVEKLTEKLRDLKCMVETREDKREDEEEKKEASSEVHTLFSSEHAVEDVPDDCDGCPALQSCTRIVQRRSKAAKRRG